VAVITMHLDAAPEAVFDVLADAWRYPDWVVGAKKIRDVDSTWPAPGSRFHHRVGFGPIDVADSTVVEVMERPSRVVLRARARPAGVARVTVDLTAAADGGTEVAMREEIISPIASRLDNPLLQGLIRARNRKSLQRLERAARTGSRP
jgi:uncharacterized protein YndB with AHSA1/START domain